VNWLGSTNFIGSGCGGGGWEIALCIKPRFASANHILRTKAIKRVPGSAASLSDATSAVKTRGRQMRITVEINLALWGMILCAGVQAAQRFAIY
jgi:hypothetical protein